MNRNQSATVSSSIGLNGSSNGVSSGNDVSANRDEKYGAGGIKRENINISDTEAKRREANLKLANPLGHLNWEDLGDMGEQYCRENCLGEADDIRAFRLGAQVAKDPLNFQRVAGLTDEEKTIFADEIAHKWRQPKKLYLVIFLCSLCAAVQGMDETVVNGAQIFYSQNFGINGPDSTWLLGLTNSGPYLCCAIIGCWLTIPFNNWFGRRGTIFLTCFYSAAACFWQAFVNTWWHMFIARFALGFGIGPKSATVPIYAAETAPPAIRGALVMCWQMFTAFGIMVGFASDLAFYQVPDRPGVTGLNWRIMMASAMFPAVIVCFFVFLCPESPRWYIQKGRHGKAWKAIQTLRFNKVQAARDLFYIQFLVKAEKETETGHKYREMISIPRNRRALQASEIVMFMQQFCGINVIAYYSSQIFLDANLSELSALGASMGFGALNFLFAIPAFFTIDTFGRRNLLLSTFPLMSLCLFFTGFSFLIPESSDARIACVALGIYLFTIVYSVGEGPVPFTYSAEAYPLYIRTQGMALATATCWFFNFVLSITWPSLLKAFGQTGAFCWYAGWNVVGFFLVLFFLPETKDKSLEELDMVFNVSSRHFAAYGVKQLGYFLQRGIGHKNAVKPVPYEDERVQHSPKSFDKEREVVPDKRV